MPKRLLTVENAFDITGRGVLVVPGPLESEYSGPRQFPVRLKLPTGEEKAAKLTLEFVRKTPAPKEPRYGCVLSDLTKRDIPVGTEVWTQT